MAAQIIQLDTFRARKFAPCTFNHSAFAGICPVATPKLTPTLTPTPHSTPSAQFQFWTGASGKRYVHTTYPFLYCPQLPACNYILVHRSPDGLCKPLAVGRTMNQARSLNLAEIRRLGANLGANEVHVHLLAGNPEKAQRVEADLHAACFNSISWSAARH